MYFVQEECSALHVLYKSNVANIHFVQFETSVYELKFLTIII